MSQLKDKYEKESGLSSGSLMCHVYASTDEYVNWLESIVEKLTASNSAMDAIAKQKHKFFVVLSKYMSSADASGLVDELVSVLQQHQ